MSLQKLPWFAFYPTDFLSSTLEMSPATVGAYIRLLSHQWIAGSIPADHAARIRICGGSEGVEWDQIQSRLVEVDGGWAHPRLLAEKERSNSIAEKRRAHIATVNSRRSQRHSDCDSNRPTTTTTTTTTTPPFGRGAGEGISDLAAEQIARRENVTVGEVMRMCEANRAGVDKRLAQLGCDKDTIEVVWTSLLKGWANTGTRPYNACLKLVDNLKGCRNIPAVIRFRASAGA
jgi:uncharacterized protein YdaU (DUF1376 family)